MIATPELSYALILILGTIVLLSLWWHGRNKPLDIFEPIYGTTAYFALLFVIRPLYDLTFESDFLGPLPFDYATGKAFNMALLYIIPCLLTFLCGYHSNFNKILTRKLPLVAPNWNARKFNQFMPLFLMIGLAIWLLLINFNGGWENYVMNKERSLTKPGQGLLLQGVSIIQSLFIISLTRSLASRRGKLLTFGLLMPINLFIGFVSGSKGAFLTPILAILISVHYLKSAVKLRYIFIFALLVAVVIPIFNVYRFATDDTMFLKLLSDSYSLLTMQSFLQNIISRFYGIDPLTYIIRDMPAVMDFQWGGTIWPLFVVWIPRVLWPDKPIISFGKIFSESFFSDFFYGTGTAASATIIGEAYINWHFPGMLIISLLGGICLRAIYEFLIKDNFGAPSVFMYATLYVALIAFWETNIAGFVADEFVQVLLLMLFVIVMGNRYRISNTPDALVPSPRQL